MSWASRTLVVVGLGGKFGMIGEGDREFLSTFIFNLFQITIRKPDQRYALETKSTTQACAAPSITTARGRRQ
jgi:hypothetical protein